MSNIINEGEDKLDIDTGYFTRESFLENSKACEKFEENITQLIRDTKKVEGGRNWYLTTITLPAGILFPDGTPEKYSWLVAPVVGIDADEMDKFPLDNESGKTYTTRVAIEDAKKFDQFKEALVYLGMQ
tara:strand:+ start:26693 stop:27079 length:387 start_codon:yes stop_codon:yes gene_type:complete